MELLVDVQGFQCGAREFIVKELAFLPLNNESKEPLVKFFEPPLELNQVPGKYKCAILWLQRNHHGIPGNYGAEPYYKVQQIFRNEMGNISKLYVKGGEKKEWVKRLLGDRLLPLVVDIEVDFRDCPSIETFRAVPSTTCIFHCNVQSMICAAKNVILLKEWITRKTTRSLSRSLHFYYRVNDLAAMCTEDIEHLPHAFISTFAAKDVQNSWNRLPQKMRADPEIADCRRCTKHHQTSPGGDEFDGPPPMIRDCHQCNF